MSNLDLPQRVGAHGVRAALGARRRPRRLLGWLSALAADDGMSDRFAAERQRAEGLVRRVERSGRR